MLSSCCRLLYTSNLGVAAVPAGGAGPSDLSLWFHHHYFLISCMIGDCDRWSLSRYDSPAFSFIIPLIRKLQLELLRASQRISYEIKFSFFNVCNATAEVRPLCTLLTVHYKTVNGLVYL
jgi:hypothetical protein